MRILLFTGKGGVGKTTLAAASAAKAADDGGKVLVVSTDQAHSLGDALGAELSADPEEVPLRSGAVLWAAEIDGRRLVDDSWDELRHHLRTVLRTAGVDEIDASELTVLPGVEDLLALAEVHRFTTGDVWDAVIVDCGPTAETLRLLSLPEALHSYLARLFPEHRRAVRGMLAGIAGSDQVQRFNDVADAVGRLAERLTALRGMLTAPETGVRVVATAEPVVAAETRRTLTALALHRLRVDAVLVNRVVPDPGSARGDAAAWLRARRREQDRVIAELRAGTDVPVVTAPHRPDSPVGAEPLGNLGEQLYTADSAWAGDPLHVDASAPGMRVERSGTGLDARYALCLSLPLPARTEVELARIGDELAVTVDGRRRLIALPSVLRRCNVGAAVAGDDGLVVDFHPDPNLWMR
ncbi:ArsA family ATPase [Bounagaea algeriensis]